MRSIVIGFVTAAAIVLAAAACKKEDTTAQNPQGWQQTQPGYAQQPAQPTATTVQPAATAYPQAQPTATVYTPPAATVAPAPTPAPAATTGMNPAPQGLPCTTDAQCLTHKCNTAAGKCSYPCQSAADCAAGMQCVAPICVPTVPGAATAH